MHRAPSTASASSLSDGRSLSDAYDPVALANLCATFLPDASTPSDRERNADVVRSLRSLAVEAEGPGAPFTKTPRGRQLFALIGVVVRNVGLHDKVGALRALQLLKANDEALRRLARAGCVPVLLRALGVEATRADAARALAALASSPEVCQTLVRGGAVETLAATCARAAAENDANARDDARWAADALERVSGRSDVYDSRALFPISSNPSETDLVAESSVKSLVEVLQSEMTVVHVDACEALRAMAASGPTGRRAVARCATVLPLVTAALGGARQRNASMLALRFLAGAMSPADMASAGNADAIVTRASRDREELTMEEKVCVDFGTASSLGGVNFFHEMIDVLGAVLELRHSLEPAAADAALALWALAWQPSNRAHMVSPTHRVTERLAALAREGCATSRDDALGVLAVLALDDDGRDAIQAQKDGARLLDYLAATSECQSPRGFTGSAGMSFEELIDRGRSHERSSTRLSFAVSRMC